MQTFKSLLILCAFLLTIGCASNQPKTANELTPFSAQGWGGTTCEELIHDISPKKVGIQSSRAEYSFI